MAILKPADLILSKSDSVVSWVIRFFEALQTGSADYSHAAMALGELVEPESVIEQLLMVVINPVKKYIGRDIAIFRNTNWSDLQRIQIACMMQQQMRQPYGILKIPLNMLDCIFRTYWFTQTFGISHFKECMQSYAWCAYKIIGTDNIFGCGWRSVSPDIAHDYCLNNPEEWGEVAL